MSRPWGKIPWEAAGIIDNKLTNTDSKKPAEAGFLLFGEELY